MGKDMGVVEQLEILRRIAENGKRQAEDILDDFMVDIACGDGGDRIVDQWVHILDEIERTKIAYERAHR